MRMEDKAYAKSRNIRESKVDGIGDTGDSLELPLTAPGFFLDSPFHTPPSHFKSLSVHLPGWFTVRPFSH
jgi:hypothetical protein